MKAALVQRLGCGSALCKAICGRARRTRDLVARGGVGVLLRGSGSQAGGELGEVADHAAMDDIGEVSFEDPAGLFLGVAVGARVGVDRLGARLAALLGDRHPVEDGVHAPVTAGVEAVADRLARPLTGRGDQRRGAVKAREPAFGEPAGVTDLDQQFRDRHGRQAAQLLERAATGVHQRRQLARDLLVL
jgi:hypothetical protein